MDQELKGAFQKLDDLMGAGIINENDYNLRKDALIEKYMSGQAMAVAAPMGMGMGMPDMSHMADTGEKPMCSVHNKMRSITCLEQVGSKDDGSPVYSCTMISQCKVNVPGAANPVAAPLQGGKGNWGGQAQGYKRPFPGAAPGGYGGAGGYGGGPGYGAGGGPMKRPRGATTWGGAGQANFNQGWQQQNPWEQQQQQQAAWGGGAWDSPDKAMCLRHQKMRSTGSMVNSGQGWICRDDVMCKVGEPGADGGTVFVCVTHNRARAINYLEQAPDGTWACKAGKECKVSVKPQEGFEAAAVAY